MSILFQKEQNIKQQVVSGDKEKANLQLLLPLENKFLARLIQDTPVMYVCERQTTIIIITATIHFWLHVVN